MGLYDFFSAGDGGYTPGGLYMKIFIMHFYAPNAFPGLHERRNERLQKKYFFSAKIGFIPQGVIHQGVIYQAFQ